MALMVCSGSRFGYRVMDGLIGGLAAADLAIDVIEGVLNDKSYNGSSGSTGGKAKMVNERDKKKLVPGFSDERGW